MAERRYISCLRVPTREQGRSGLSLERQRQAVAEFVEVESGRRSNRPQLRCTLAAFAAH
jgi:hypothetical protein